MLEIYVDNKKMKFNLKTTKTLSSIIKTVTKQLEKENKIVKNIYLNGKYIEDIIFYNNKDKNIIEFETKSTLDILFENFLDAKDTFENSIFSVVINIDENEQQKDLVFSYSLEEIYDTREFLIFYKDLLNFTYNNYISDYNIENDYKIFDKFSVYFNIFSIFYKKFEKLLNDKRYEEIFHEIVDKKELIVYFYKITNTILEIISNLKNIERNVN